MSALSREQARELQRLHDAVAELQAGELPLDPTTVGVDRAELGGRAAWVALAGKGLVRIDRQAGPRGGDRWVLHLTRAGMDRVAAIRHYRARATA